MVNGDAKLVMIHALANNKDSWQFVELDLLGRGDIGYYEMPGHGQKPRQPDARYADMADEVVHEFDGPLDLVGIAVGASVALNVIVRHPRRVRSAVLVSGSPGGGGNPASRQALIERGEGAVRDGMASVIDATFDRWFSAWSRLANPPGIQWARNTLLNWDPHAWSDIWRATATSESLAPERIQAISQPVTLVGAIHDATSGTTGGEKLHSMIPNSRLQYVAGPHMLHLERPRSLLSAMDQHFTWLRVSGTRVEPPLYFQGE